MPAPEQSPAITEAKLKAPPRYISVKSTEAAQFGISPISAAISGWKKVLPRSISESLSAPKIQRKRENKQKTEDLQRMCESRYKNSLVLVAVTVLPLTYVADVVLFLFGVLFYKQVNNVTCSNADDYFKQQKKQYVLAS